MMKTMKMAFVLSIIIIIIVHPYNCSSCAARHVTAWETSSRGGGSLMSAYYLRYKPSVSLYINEMYIEGIL